MFENIFFEINFFIIIIFLFLTATFVLFSDLLKKINNKINKELLRKIPHTLIGLLFTISPVFMTQKEIIVFSLTLIFAILAAKNTNFFKSVFKIQRITYGMWLTPISLVIMAFLWLPLNPEPFYFGMLVLTFSDSLAALFGKFFGKKKILKTNKTFIGSIVFFIITFILYFYLAKNKLSYNYFIIPLILTIIEIILSFGLDNLFLPIIASFLFNSF